MQQHSRETKSSRRAENLLLAPFLLLFRVDYFIVASCIGKLLNCFDYESLSARRRSRTDELVLGKFRRTAACRLRRSPPRRLFTAIPSRIILSQFNQPVIKELGLTLQTLFLHLRRSRRFFLPGRSKLNFLYLRYSSFVGARKAAEGRQGSAAADPENQIRKGCGMRERDWSRTKRSERRGTGKRKVAERRNDAELTSRKEREKKERGREMQK